MPTAVWFSLLALLYVIGMAGYHGRFLVTRFVLPEPRSRARRDWKSVLSELFLTAVVVAPLLRRVLPTLAWVRGPSTAAAAVFYVATFAWLPLLKAVALCAIWAAPRREAALAGLYSVPVTLLYLAGVGYLLCVTLTMLALS